VQHNLEVILVVISPGKTPMENRYLLHYGHNKCQLPSARLENESTLQRAARMLEELTGWEARIMGRGSVDLVPCPLADGVSRVGHELDEHGNVYYLGEEARPTRFIGVPYGCVLREEWAKCSDHFSWLDLAHICNASLLREDDLDILVSATARVAR
jgi:hypothetical protein